MFDLAATKIAVIGLGYVGLPVAVEFGKQFDVIGFDINIQRVEALQQYVDKTGEHTVDALRASTHLRCTWQQDDLKEANVYIVTVPTPVDKNHQPDLTPLKNASRTLAAYLAKGDIVIYESTVYPGATEEECVPVLEWVSGLTFNRDFFAAYSPERINPGDKEHTITHIKKITSGSMPAVADFVDKLYRRIITAGTHKVSSIKIAEAAKVIENTQRDLNIALVNELAIIFNRLDIDTHEVLQAAATKWNFLPFKPGLVGGHCIGIDPYYLTYKAESSGYHPDVILAGRKINDGMGKYVVSRLIRAMIRRRIHVSGANILIMGFAFKENCADIRNTKVMDMVSELDDYNAIVDVYDPLVDKDDALMRYNMRLIDEPTPGHYHALIVAVGHGEFAKIHPERIKSWCAPSGLIYDLKGFLDEDLSDFRL
ncbi:MAG: nucleotide sugar dehydrogenase [Cellvibrionaceae bacterium]|nr:nucleotide sugar dehydrogenase [Cellvibrionaceae bacterium]